MSEGQRKLTRREQAAYDAIKAAPGGIDDRTLWTAHGKRIVLALENYGLVTRRPGTGKLVAAEGKE